MVKKYTYTIDAVQWDGSENMLEFLKTVFPESHKIWITDDGGLRISRKHRQGELYIPNGDYIEIANETFWHHSKQVIEIQYNLSDGNG